MPTRKQADDFATGMAFAHQAGVRQDRLQTEHTELKAALAGLVGLVEAWIDGPMARAGLLWENTENHPPTLKAARAILQKLKEEA